MITPTQIKNAKSTRDLALMLRGLKSPDLEVQDKAKADRAAWSEAGCPIWLSRASGTNRATRRHPPKDYFSRSKPRPAPRANLEHA